MKLSPIDQIKNANAPRGFALIATISVMVLLVLIALAMLSLSTIELRATKHGNAQAEARANARLGLELAIGELQAALGPDSRATANAAILDTDPSTPSLDGVQHPHWLGVYPTMNPDSVDDGLINARSLRDWSLNNTQWLVSSSDAHDPTANLTGDSVSLAQFINDPSVVVPSSDQINTLSPTLLSKAQAGLIEVKKNAISSGRFAWWVGDESMKARVDTLASASGNDVLNGSVVDTQQQQQANYEITQGTNFSKLLPGYNNTPAELEKVITSGELGLLAQAAAGSSWENWGTLNRDKFTPYSLSLPVDVTSGRLKQDLTAYFKGSYSGHDYLSMIDPRFNLSASRTPSFSLLKQWAELVDDPKVEQPVVAPSHDTSSPQHGLHPIITQGAVGLQFSYKILSPTTFNAVFMIQPQIQLWNPHNVPLAAQDYVVQLGYQFKWWMKADGGRNTDKVTFSGPTPQWQSWQMFNQQDPLPLHQPADNEDINYQNNKRFFTFVIKNQAFKAGESLVFYAKPPNTGPISGVPYNINSDTDTEILKNYSSDSDLNLLINEGSFDEFFYLTSPIVGTVPENSSINLTNLIRSESNFQSQIVGTDLTDQEDLDMHLNLYAHLNGKPTLLHAIKKPQRNIRFGNWQRPTYPLKRFQDGELFAAATFDGKSALINFGSAMLPSNFDIFSGGKNVNLPPKAGQPHATLGYWNIRNQTGFSSSDAWPTSSQEGTTWINAFSFRDTTVFKNTWETTDNYYGNLSTDRLGGWHLSQVQSMVYSFFDYPTGPHGPLSLGSFQHANLSSYSWQPTYAFGNAQAPPRFDRTNYQSDSQPDLYDVSYLVNASTWDRYYLSTIPQGGTALTSGMRLPNSRQFLTQGPTTQTLDTNNITNANGFDQSAAYVLVHGGFNVNSTSTAAWEAFLSGALGQSVDTLLSGKESNTETAAPMGRFLSPLLDEPEATANDRAQTEFDSPNTWASTRTLSPQEIRFLAVRIVEEVKRRGPFLSLADFVNRRLKPDSDITGDERVYQEVLGTLQAAINKTTLRDQQVNHHFALQGQAGGLIMSIDPDTDWSDSPPTGLVFTVSESAQESMFGYPISDIKRQGGLIHNYAPNFLSQADVLTKIGPSITVRGDTYVIRSYGDSINASNGEIEAKAWCEAVVQRVAQPVGWDGTEDQLIQPNKSGKLDFGRRFKVISFRWLSENDVHPFSNDAAITQ